MRLIDSYCDKCNKKGFRVPEGEFIHHFVKTNQTFPPYCEEQMGKGINIIHDIDGCSMCNPALKWPPGLVKRFLQGLFGGA